MGKNNVEESLASIQGYRQFEYVHEELADILAATDFCITRGGSNAIFEFLAFENSNAYYPTWIRSKSWRSTIKCTII